MRAINNKFLYDQIKEKNQTIEYLVRQLDISNRLIAELLEESIILKDKIISGNKSNKWWRFW